MFAEFNIPLEQGSYNDFTRDSKEINCKKETDNISAIHERHINANDLATNIEILPIP